MNLLGCCKYFLNKRCGLDFCFRDPTGFLEECSLLRQAIPLWWSYWNLSPTAWRSKNYKVHRKDCTWRIKMEGMKKLQEIPHTWSLDAFWMRWRFFLEGGSLEDVDGCWKEHHQRVHHGQDMGTVGRSRIWMVRGEELPETKPVSGNAYTYCHIVPTNQSTAKSAPREPHFRRYSVSRRELGDTDVFVPKTCLKQRLGKAQR